MQTNKILSAPLIDIIFDGRNKDYGAYELRKNLYQKGSAGPCSSRVITFALLWGQRRTGQFIRRKRQLTTRCKDR